MSIGGDTVMDVFFVDFFAKKMIEERSVKAFEISMDWSANMHFSHKELPKNQRVSIVLEFRDLPPWRRS